ncbi:MAG: DNA polymerase III subunit gamma/tau [Bacilli bacterium]|nr:DNA polymerase III subunit gamma/tau [Bacilli bacterium]
MYQTLYRKYRPNNFDEVIGQNIIIKTLKNAIKKKQISHAYLFAGPRGTGKTSVAKIFAKTINCENLKNENPCNLCVNCTQIINKQNTDIIEIDAASNNGIDEIRELKNKVNLVPTYGKYKVYIIDEVHMLTVGAFNALLKTLEEPPTHTIFILATTDPHKIPATIISRCQRFDFKKISINEIEKQIENICNKESIQIEEDASLEIATLADGGLRDAIGILDQAYAYANFKITKQDIYDINGLISEEEIKNILLLIAKKQIKIVYEKIDDYNNNGKSMLKLSEKIIELFKNVMVYNISNDKNNNLYDEILEYYTIDQINKIIFDIIEIMSKSKYYTDFKIVVEMIILKLYLLVDKYNNNNNKTEVINTENEKPLLKKTSSEINEQNREKSKIEKEDYEQIKKYQNIRINNTLSRVNKREIAQLKDKIKDVYSYVLQSDYSKAASLLIDGKIKAASEEHIVFVYNTKLEVEDFLINIENIEKLLIEILQKKYKVIAIDQPSWEIIRRDFNNKTKTFVYDDTEDKLNNIIKKINSKKIKKNTIEETFDDIIEYSEER